MAKKDKSTKITPVPVMRPPAVDEGSDPDLEPTEIDTTGLTPAPKVVTSEDELEPIHEEPKSGPTIVPATVKPEGVVRLQDGPINGKVVKTAEGAWYACGTDATRLLPKDDRMSRLFPTGTKFQKLAEDRFRGFLPAGAARDGREHCADAETAIDIVEHLTWRFHSD